VTYLEFEQPLAELEQRIAELHAAAEGDESARAEIVSLERQVERIRARTYADLSVWQKVQLSRHPDRPYFRDYLDRMFEDFVELHGDRRFADDGAIIAGLARFGGRGVVVIGHQKGRTTKDKLDRNFGMAHPEGYRKAMRVMELAERFGRPVFTFIDTPGAYPGIGAEQRGQSEAIGASILLMAGLSVPVIATVIGEGGSGGALALGVANRVLMMEFATYSVITPEGCASILWRDGARAPDAAEQLGLLANDAAKLNIVDEIISEPLGGAHRDIDGAAMSVKGSLERHLRELSALTPERLTEDRYRKFRALGAMAAG
jgi:acetyl-CoA carboxylase carboxyl transferase subunit alpha